MVKEADLTEWIAPTLEQLGYVLWGLEFHNQGQYSSLRVYIDAPAGIGVADCQRVSHQLSALLDVNDPIKHRYALEVSSPGLDRRLFTLAQYSGYIGATIRLQVVTAINGQKRFKGILSAVLDEAITLILDDKQQIEIPFSAVAKAHIEPMATMDK